MVKRIDILGKRLELMFKTVNHSPSSRNAECRNFLKKTLKKYIFPNANNLSQTEIIQRLEILEKSTRRIANALAANELRRKEGLPDTGITFEEMEFYKKLKMRELIKSTKAIIEIINEGLTFPSAVSCIIGETTSLYLTKQGTAGRKIIEESLVSRLKKLLIALENETVENKPLLKAKKGKAVFKLTAIHALTQAWVDLTGKSPEKLKRNRKTGLLYGEFHDFMKGGLKLFKNIANIEDAIKEAERYYIEELVRKPHQ